MAGDKSALAGLHEFHEPSLVLVGAGGFHDLNGDAGELAKFLVDGHSFKIRGGKKEFQPGPVQGRSSR